MAAQSAAILSFGFYVLTRLATVRVKDAENPKMGF
jgi:hypothetical protein